MGERWGRAQIMHFHLLYPAHPLNLYLSISISRVHHPASLPAHPHSSPIPVDPPSPTHREALEAGATGTVRLSDPDVPVTLYSESVARGTYTGTITVRGA